MDNSDIQIVITDDGDQTTVHVDELEVAIFMGSEDENHLQMAKDWVEWKWPGASVAVESEEDPDDD